ncbi:DNA-binding protein [Muribaculum sp. NM65_B17]|nr:DNA-binding protein [Muribaculum sp. NM65_B17]THG44803.1 helix-turn-helix domain-containing protein [Muribaculaceae bacterium]
MTAASGTLSPKSYASWSRTVFTQIWMRMRNEIVTKSDMRILAARSQTQKAFEAVGIIRDSHHPVLAGVCFLDDKEVAERLRVTRRTVQNYRDKGILSYYMICGKCLYPEHEIQQMLDENYHPPYYD